MRRIGVVAIAAYCLVLASCSSGPPPIKNKVPVTKVKGIVTVNGQPVKNVMVRCLPTAPIAEKRREFIIRFVVFTNEDGSFALRTYAADDGLPAGNYALTFKWFPPTEEERKREGAENDRLDGKYLDMKDSVKSFTVEEGKPLDLGMIDLKADWPPKK